MATEVPLPELGESVTDGILTEWLVAVGDTVEVDQPLFEISTDKIDTEVPSPVAGVVQELRAEVDDTIEVGQVLLVIGDGDGAASGGSSSDEAASNSAEEAAPEPDEAPAPEPEAPAQQAPAAPSAPAAPAGSAATASAGAAAAGGASGAILTSPLVRKILREAGIDAANVQGSGPGGRITREDAERAVAGGGGRAPAPPAGGGASAPAAAAAGGVATGAVQQVAAPAQKDRPQASPLTIEFNGEREKTEKLTRVRSAIAKAMMHSLQSTAQLTAAVEVDMTRIMTLRAAHKDAFKARHGASLSPLPLVARAVMLCMHRHPALNATMDLEAGTATYYNHVNLGMAVDTEKGLIVPNIKDAQNLTVAGLAQGIAGLAKKARGKGLTPDDISGGTFTITNTGSVGTLFDTPILNAPESAILATCAVEKRPVVVSDAMGDSIAIRWMSYLCLSYDHRIVDGADAARFLQDVKWVCENHDFTSEVA